MRAAARATDAMTSALAGRARVRGQAMVEFIVIASVLLLLIMGTIQFAMIYQAKITLNYAAFETARAGSLNSARMWAMELAFARAMAPLYTTPYVKESGGNCTSEFEIGRFDGPNVGLELSNVKCARQHVRDMLAERNARILPCMLRPPIVRSFHEHHQACRRTSLSGVPRSGRLGGQGHRTDSRGRAPGRTTAGLARNLDTATPRVVSFESEFGAGTE